MWFKEHKKHIIISVVALLVVAAALVGGIFIGRANSGKPSGGDATTEASTTVDTTEESKDTTEAAVVSSVYDVVVSTTSNWGSEGAYGATYNVAFTNKSEADVSAWYAEMEVPQGSNVTESWGCTAEINGTKLTVTATEWGAAVTKGNKIDVGFNMNSPTQVTPTISALYVDGNKQDGSTVVASSEEDTEEASTEAVAPAVKPEMESGTPVENHGALRVEGTQLVDEDGDPYQLKGVSTHGLAWFPAYVNKDAFQTIRDDWGGNVVRLAMYTHENGGYCSGGDKEQLKSLIDNGVNYATELGMYVIIDWHILHDLDPTVNQAEAEKFFAEMSAKYADYDNVIYEICNEPNGGTTWQGSIRPYAETIIPIIHGNDPDAVIIVGTPTWSQDVDIVADDVAANPLKDSKNVMYAVHFYAATHTDNIRNKVTYALDKGLPIFVSEFSLCDASGNGANDFNQADKWFDLINSNNLSYCSWSLSNKAETSALISSSCTKTSGWTEAELSDTGKWIRNQIRGE
ncbi:MAG: cellulase family glycosylhydrolase [Lachnospiraceae bacterium]|nr:cellulase family glycosylhydrolase [Lachnospiraceae bacterium]